MVKLGNLKVVGVSLMLCASSAWAAEAKPNFSGTWLLDKEKSDLSSPPGDSQRRVGGPRLGGGGGGWPGMGRPRMGGLGGPGMGGPRIGGPGMGGPEMDPGTRRGGSDTDNPRQEGGMRGPRMGTAAEKLVIDHVEPTLTVKRSFKMGDEEQVQELKYTTDGKSGKNSLPDGRSIKSKTHWEGSQLITKSDMETPGGKMEVIENRSLSQDGKAMVVELTTKGGSMEWTRRLVYVREANTPEADQKDK